MFHVSSNCMGLKIWSSWARMAVINSSWQWNYMGKVSRLLIASPRPRLMETFFLILFSSLIGIDAPYLLIYMNVIFLFSIIIHQMVVVVLCGQWGNHLHWCTSINLLFWWGTVLLFQIGCKNSSFVILLNLSCFSYVPYIQFSIISVPCILFCFKLCTMDTLLCSVLHHKYSSVIFSSSLSSSCVSSSWISSS